MPNVWKSRPRDTTWDGVISAALNYPYKTRHVAGVVDDEPTAREAAAGIYRARRHFKVAAKSGVEQDPASGKWTVWFMLFDPDDAKRYIAEKVARGEPLTYNVLRGRKLCTAQNAARTITPLTARSRRPRKSLRPRSR